MSVYRLSFDFQKLISTSFLQLMMRIILSTSRTEVVNPGVYTDSYNNIEIGE